MSRQKLLVTFLLLTTITIAQGATYFKLTKVYCETNPKFVYNTTCYLKAMNRYKSVAMMETRIIDKLSNTSVNVATFVRNSANTYQPFVINATVNICQVLERSNQGPYGIIIEKLMTTFTNVNHPCPFKGILKATNVYMNASHYPVTFPMNSYKIVFTFYENYPVHFLGRADFNMDFIEDKRKSR